MKTKLEQATELAREIIKITVRNPKADPVYILRDNILAIMEDYKKQSRNTHQMEVMLIDPDDSDIHNSILDHNINAELLETFNPKDGKYGGGRVLFTGFRETLEAFSIDIFHCHEMLTYITRIKQ